MLTTIAFFESCGFAVCSTGSSQLYRRRKAPLKITTKEMGQRIPVGYDHIHVSCISYRFSKSKHQHFFVLLFGFVATMNNEQVTVLAYNDE